MFSPPDNKKTLANITLPSNFLLMQDHTFPDKLKSDLKKTTFNNAACNKIASEK
jgi:uncharacterized protein YktB (UPF0637 family)